MSNVLTESLPSPPLKVYSRLQTSQRPPSVSPLVLDLPTPPAPTVEPDLSVAIRKGIRSIHNPSPHYTTLSYHRLSQLFYACLSSISLVSIPKSVGDALAHPGWRQAMLDELSALHNSGTWESFLYPLENLLLVAGGFSLSKLVLMALLIVSKLILWLKATPKFLVSLSFSFLSSFECWVYLTSCIC